MMIASAIETALYRADIPALRKALQGADVNAADADGRTPLMLAVCAATANRIEVMKVLIESGADVGAADRRGWTALHFAAQDQKLEEARVLLDANAPVGATEENGNEPLFQAVMNGAHRELVALLLAAGADPEHRNVGGMSVYDAAQILGASDALPAK